MVIFIFFAACGTENKVVKYNGLLLTDEYLEINLADRSADNSKCISYYEDLNQLWMLDDLNNGIKAYDLGTGNLVYKAEFEFVGPKGVGKIYGFDRLSPDSLIVYSLNRKIYLLDAKSNIIKEYEYSNTNEGIGVIYRYSMINLPVFFNGSHMIGYKGTVGDWTRLKQEDLNLFNLELKLDLKTGEVEQLPMKFPNDYLLRGPQKLETSRVSNGKSYVYSFSSDPSVYLVSSEFEYLKKAQAKSEFINDHPPIPKGVDIVSMQSYTLRNGFYRSIVYDKYRDVYYRFCDLPIELPEEENYRLYIMNRPLQSIILLDSDLNKIDELVLPKSTYRLDNYFVNSEGLYISYNSDLNNLSKEDVLRFYKVEVKHE